MKSKYSLADYAFQFITVTVGMFIALFINGLVEWNQNRELVVQARATIRREIADNQADLARTAASFESDQAAMLNAVRFAEDLLSTGKTKLTGVDLHYSLADQIFDTSWRTAERTGALSLMDYGEVQKYSKLYDFQELFMQQQRQVMAQLTLASSIFAGGFDIEHPNLKDLETFRSRVLDLMGTVAIQKDFAKKLDENYAAALKQ